MRIASCRCGQLRAQCTEEPLRVSVCHCRECQRRTGSVFSAQARFRAESVIVTGVSSTYTRTADSGSQLTYQFCASCGATITYQIDTWPDVVAVPVGAFGDCALPTPAYSIYERRMRPWVTIAGDSMVHLD
jgi:hypothetical protein